MYYEEFWVSRKWTKSLIGLIVFVFSLHLICNFPNWDQHNFVFETFQCHKNNIFFDIFTWSYISIHISMAFVFDTFLIKLIWGPYSFGHFTFFVATCTYSQLIIQRYSVWKSGEMLLKTTLVSSVRSKLNMCML